MAGFKYAMENILRIKERLEEQKRMALGQAIADYQSQLDVQKAIEDKRQTCLDGFHTGQKGRHRVLELQRMSQQVSWYEERLKQQQELVTKALKVVEARREELKKALEERKIQEKLKENAYERFLEEEKKKEHQMLDEIVGYRYAADDEQNY